MNVPSAAQPNVKVRINNESSINVVHLAGRQGNGPTILFLHANGFHINCTAPLVRWFRALFGLTLQTAALASAFTQARCFEEHTLCIGIEFRGQGSLPPPDSAEHLVEAYIQDVLAVMTALQLKGKTGSYVYLHAASRPCSQHCCAIPLPCLSANMLNTACSSCTPVFPGCYCFGHSGGGQVALAAEAQHPGTFAATYAYEPVLSNAPQDTTQQ